MGGIAHYLKGKGECYMLGYWRDCERKIYILKIESQSENLNQTESERTFWKRYQMRSVRIWALTPLEGEAYKLMGKAKRDIVRLGMQLKGKTLHPTSVWRGGVAGQMVKVMTKERVTYRLHIDNRWFGMSASGFSEDKTNHRMKSHWSTRIECKLYGGVRKEDWLILEILSCSSSSRIFDWEFVTWSRGCSNFVVTKQWGV